MSANTAHREALTRPVASIAEELQRDLGQRVVAYCIGMRTPRLVGRWAAGASISRTAETRLRELYRVHLILGQEFDASVIRAWIAGANPDLDDRTPADVLHENNAVAVFHAAEAFVEPGPNDDTQSPATADDLVPEPVGPYA